MSHYSAEQSPYDLLRSHRAELRGLRDLLKGELDETQATATLILLVELSLELNQVLTRHLDDCVMEQREGTS